VYLNVQQLLINKSTVLLILKFKAAIVAKLKVICTTLLTLVDIVFLMIKIICLLECKQEYKLLKVYLLKALKENIWLIYIIAQELFMQVLE